MDAMPEPYKADEEQLLYAKVLATGMYIGLAVLFVTFFLYAMGVVEPAVPVDQLSQYWDGTKGDPGKKEGVVRYLDAMNKDFLHMDHAPIGWAWLGMLDRGDYLNFLGIAILSAITILCFLAIVPVMLRKKDLLFMVMALLEAAVLALAASGILAVGH